MLYLFGRGGGGGGGGGAQKQSIPLHDRKKKQRNKSHVDKKILSLRNRVWHWCGKTQRNKTHYGLVTKQSYTKCVILQWLNVGPSCCIMVPIHNVSCFLVFYPTYIPLYISQREIFHLSGIRYVVIDAYTQSFCNGNDGAK